MDDTRISHQDPRSSQINRSNMVRRTIRRQLIAALILSGTVGLTSSGCAGRSMSLASMNPFQSKSSETTGVSTPSKLASTTGKVATGTVTATKNMASKTASTVGGWFGGGSKSSSSDPDDPLSLANSPDKLEPEVFVANGQLWESTGNLAKAMESYAKALETAPDNGPALTSIARLHFREGNYSQSAEYFQKAIAQSPNDAALYNDLGLTLSKLNQHEMSAQTLQRALDLAPGTSRYANNLASVHFESGKPEQALNVLKANNKPAVAHFNMAFLYYKKGQTAEAQAHLTQSLGYENEASSDPATKRAIDRSREMLAQLNPGKPLPTGTPRDIGPAAGPSAVIAANPAHRPTQNPQVLGQLTPQQAAAANTPVSYQDPRSYMSPHLPPGATAPAAQPATEPAASTPDPTAATPPPASAAPPANPATPPATGGFSLPSGFELPQ